MSTVTKTVMLAAMLLTANTHASLAGSNLYSNISGDGGQYTVTDLGRGEIYLHGHGHAQHIDIFRTGSSALDIFGSGSGTTGSVFDSSIGGENRVVFGICPGGRTQVPVQLNRSHGLIIADCP